MTGCSGNKGTNSILAVFFLFLTIIFFLPSDAIPEELDDTVFRLITPQQNEEVIGKKPLIRIALPKNVTVTSILVILDDVDITDVMKITDETFDYQPLTILASGAHTLYIRYALTDGQEREQAFSFSTRHTKAFEEAYSANEVTAVYEAVLDKPRDVRDVPYSKVEANWGTFSTIREGKWRLSLKSNLRFLDQNLPVFFPEKKGINIADYLLQAEYSGDELHFLAELGDVQIQETQYTVFGLARRGGRLVLNYKNAGLHAFVVNSEEVFGFSGGMGIGSSTDDHIMGLSGTVNLFSNRALFKAVYVTGGEEGSTFGIFSEGGLRKGEVLGFVLSGDIIEQKLSAEAEVDFSKFDPDTSDEFSAERDKAYRLRLGGFSGVYSYEAVYEYVGPDYEVIGNQGLQRDREGILIRAGANYPMHTLNFSFARYNDNVDGNDLYPRVNSYQGIVDYQFLKYQHLPMGISYEKSILNSESEPEFTLPLEVHTDTISGRINYVEDPWNIGLTAGYSVQDDRTEQANDSDITNVTITPTYFIDHLSVSTAFAFNRSDFDLTDVYTDTYTATLDLRGDIFNEKVAYEFAGTFNRTESSDDSIKLDTFNANARVSHTLGSNLWGFLRPSVGIRAQYIKTDDRVFDQENDEMVVWLVLAARMPFTF